MYVQVPDHVVTRDRIPEHGMLPDTALQVVRDELILDGNARLNLATFVTTWMEPQAEQLMAECFSKNMIDKDEYPQTAELERRCVSILAHLWHAGGTAHRLLDDRVQRGVHAGRHGAAVAVAGPRRPRRRRRRRSRTWSWARTSRSAGTSSAATGRSSRGRCRWSRAGCT